MVSASTLTKQTRRIIPQSKGILQNSVTGIGADRLLRILDNIVGSPVQRIFSFNIPILGTIGPIDVINYVGHAGGFKFSKKGFIAVGAAKISSGVLTQIGGISLPGSSVGGSSAVAAGTRGGPI